MKYSCTHEATYKEAGIDYTPNLIETLQQEQINELKAQVNYLRDALLMIAMPTGGDQANANHNIAIKALEATPDQCLAEVKAKAIEDAIDVVRGSFATLTALRVYANQLREQAK